MAKSLAEISKSSLFKQNQNLKKKVKTMRESAQETGEQVLCGMATVMSSGATAYAAVRNAKDGEMIHKIGGLPSPVWAAGAQIIGGAVMGGSAGNALIASGIGSASAASALAAAGMAMKAKSEAAAKKNS